MFNERSSVIKRLAIARTRLESSSRTSIALFYITCSSML